MKQGHVVFSPISHSVPVDTFIDNGDHDFWLNQDKWFLDRSDEVFVLCLDEWEKSYGIDWEIKRAIKKGIRVTYIDEDLNEVFPT
jgi:hypothetical protein